MSLTSFMATASLFLAMLIAASPVSGRNISIGYFGGVISTSAEDQSAGWITGIDCKFEIINHLVVRPIVGSGQFGDTQFSFGAREGSAIRMFSLDLLYHYYPCANNRYGGYLFVGQTIMRLSREFDETSNESWMAWGLGLEYAVGRRWFLELNGRFNNLNSGYATAGARLAINYRISAPRCDHE